MNLDVRALRNADRAWVRRLLEAHWGATVVVSRGRLHHADRLPGLLAVHT